jgi:hypothetical protein
MFYRGILPPRNGLATNFMKSIHYNLFIRDLFSDSVDLSFQQLLPLLTPNVVASLGVKSSSISTSIQNSKLTLFLKQTVESSSYYIPHLAIIYEVHFPQSLEKRRELLWSSENPFKRALYFLCPYHEQKNKTLFFNNRLGVGYSSEIVMI